MMNKKPLLKLGIPFIALSMIAACGTDDGNDPVDDEAPLIEDDDGAPLNPDDDNGDMDGERDEPGDMTDDPEDEDLEEEFDNQNGNGGTGNQ